MASLQEQLLPANAHQLDRLGSELKCPVCLSLFKQAASLSCNHSFCTSCILQSIKRNPVCPICKVHTTRREVRAAPQMDSLVAIYISMETAAGIELLASQAPSGSAPVRAPSTQKHGSKNRKALRNITNVARVKNRSKSLLNSPASPKQLLKGFLPAKKRVQVPRFSSLSGELGLSEDDASASKTQISEKSIDDSRKPKNSIGGQNDKGALSAIPASALVQLPDSKRPCPRKRKKSEVSTVSFVHDTQHNFFTKSISTADSENENGQAEVEKLAMDDMGRPKLAPFFWLRDESSQDPDGNDTTQATQPTQTQPRLTPSFSDLKDNDNCSDEENEKEFKKARSAEAHGYESDAFEWTQQPCSPELNCSPVRVQECDDIVIDLPVESTEEPYDNQDQTGNLSKDKSPPKTYLATSKCAPSSSKRKALKASRQREESFEENGEMGTPGKLHTYAKVKRGLKVSLRDVYSKTVDGGQRQVDLRCSSLEGPSQGIKKADAKALDDSIRKVFKNTSRGSKRSRDCIMRLKKTISPVSKRHSNRREPLVEHRLNGSNSRAKEVFQSTGNNEVLLKGSEVLCAFCRMCGNSQVAGPMMHYKNGLPVEEWESETKLVHVHRLCAEWAPDVYFEEDVAKNLEAEVGRGQKIKCSSCGTKGAALGCCLKRCRRSYHYPCARSLSCKWENDKFIVLCPEHATQKFPGRQRTERVVRDDDLESAAHVTKHAQSSFTQCSTAEKISPKWPSSAASKWVLSGSGLDSAGKAQLAAFASLTGATITKAWSSSITHVISGTDEHGAARRTLKFLMAILEGKWILNSNWLEACTVAGMPVSEKPFEITIDIHGTAKGPKRGRMLAAAKGSRLFGTLQFYFMCNFVTSYKADLQALVAAAGGRILHRKPVISADYTGQEHTIVVYNNEASTSDSGSDQAELINRRQLDATTLAALLGAHAVPQSWILDSIASCRVQPLD